MKCHETEIYSKPLRTRTLKQKRTIAAPSRVYVNWQRQEEIQVQLED